MVGLLAFQQYSTVSEAATADLFFSEYVEGSSNNKYLEIYNGTGASVNLATLGYQVEFYFNGSSTVGSTIPLTGTIADNGVYILADDEAALAVTPNQTTTATFYNGDDAIVLRKGAGGPIIDVIGDVGFDPGTEWGTGATSTADNTLRRKSSVCAGDTNATDDFVPATEWDGFNQNDITGLGSHTANCGGAGTLNLSVTDVSQAEGNAGTSTFTFTVNLSAPAPSTVTFDIATADGTAQDDNPATEDNDYVAKSETGRTIAAGASSATFTVTVNGDTTTEPNETFFVNVTNPSGGGGVTVTDGQGQGTITNDDISALAINQIQGSGMASPHAGTQVTTTGIVTARRSLGASNNGFFIQNPNPDSDPNTSEAILVFTGSTVPTVGVGDSVQVTGTVTEFESSTTDEPNGVSPPDPKTATELVGPLTISVQSTGNSLPAALDAPSLNIFNPAATSRGAQLEKYEFMRVSVPSLTVSEPTNNFGEFWGVVTGFARPFREPGIERGDPVPAADQGPYTGSAPPNVPIWDGNFERIMVDSGAGLVATGSTRRAQVQVTTGTVVTNIVGPLDYAFDNYRIVLDYNVTPGTSGGLTAAVPVPTPVAGEFTIASANLENFTNNAGRLNKASLAVRNVMRTPDIVGVIEVLDQATLTALANKINSDAANPSAVNYQAYLSETSATQDIGFLVNTARVTVVGTPTAQFVGKTFTYAGETDTLHDRPPFILTADVPQSSGGGTFRVSVMLNHNKSLIAVDSPRARGAGGTEGARNREKRRLQAEDIADLIQARQNENLVVMGDFNAFDFNDGLGDVMGTIKGTPAPPEQVVEPSTDRWTFQLYNSLARLPADQQYSLLFEGNAQALDHILLNQNMRVRQTRFAYGRYNADFSESFAADTNRPERLSDHDSAVSYFVTSPVAQPGEVLISEFRFNGPNGTDDEFIELYNNSDSQVSLNGWSIAAPAGTGGGGVAELSGSMLPRGHYLVGMANHSVSSYPSADDEIFTAVPDRAYPAALFLDDGGAQLRDNNGTVIDSVGFASANGTGFREGAGLNPAGGVTPGLTDQYSFVRKMTTGFPQDTNDNAADFVLVSTSGAVGSTVAILGAPGPENTESPIQRNALIKASLIDNCNSIGTPTGGCQNRVRNGAASDPTNAATGTLSFRRKFTNTSPNEAVYRLRFRVVDITTLNSPGYAPNNGQADLRVLSSEGGTVTPSNPFTPGDVTVVGTTLETPPEQGQGGGLNSSLTVNLDDDPLLPGESLTVELLVGVQQNGFYRFFVNVEATTGDTPSLPPAVKSRQGKNGAIRR